MSIFNLPDKDEMEIQRKRIAELEKANQELRAENMALNQDITKRKRAEETLRQSEQRVRLNLEDNLSPSRKAENLELAEIIDVQAVQSIMDDFYKFAHITMALLDLKGNILICVGWQDICTKFHRVHPETCKHCVESDTKLSTGVPPGEFKLYRCKNNMWDIVTPIIVAGQHIGNIFSGQFFFDDEPLDYELFRSQARKYGFNEEEYIAALERVPRLSREIVETSMSFFMKLANMLSQLSHSNIKLAQSLEERDILVDKLEKSSEDFDRAQAVGNIGSWHLDVRKNELTWSDENHRIFGIQKGTPLTYETFLSTVHPDDREYVDKESKAGLKGKPYDIEHRIVVDGKIKWVREKAYLEFDKDGAVIGGFGITQDITERKQAEDELRVREERLRRMSHAGRIGLYEWNADRGLIHFSHEAYELYGCDPESPITYEKWLERVHPDDRKMVERDIAKAHKNARDTHDISARFEFRVMHTNGTVLWLEAMSTYYLEGDDLIARGAVRDITERKRAEEALKRAHDTLEEKVKERTAELEKTYNSLKESERSLAEAQSLAHIGNWDWNLVTGEVHWSGELYRIFGRTPQEFAATYDEFLSYVHPDDRDLVDTALKKAFNGEPSAGGDYRIILANGEERNVHTYAEVIFDKKNAPIRIKGTVQDITERKRAEEKIQTLANAVESSNDAIVTESLDGIITSWNKAAEQVYGYSAEEILGKDVSILEPDNIKGEIKQFSEKIKQGKKVQHYETSRLKKDGTIINISVTLSPVFDVTGKLVAISAIVRDITERIKAEKALRESEARLRRFYESSIIGVFYYNLDGSITDSNDKLLEMIGYTREDLQAGRIKWDKITPPEYRHLDECAAAELRATGVNTPYEKEYFRKDGSRIPIIIGSATFDQARNEGIAFVLDITERKKAEKALVNLEITRKKEIHHRIKNNLQVISSLLDLQAEKFNNPKVIEAFHESQNRVISMALIHEELYKGEGIDTLDFSEYLQELAENLFQTYSLSSKNIHLNTDLEENTFFDMDIAVPLGIIVNELISNSLKHAFPGRDKGEIRIKLRREENREYKKEANKITNFILTVSDNGIGIPKNIGIEDLDSLGIQLITTLVDQLDGELELKRNDGTEFAIRFTVAEK